MDQDRRPSIAERVGGSIAERVGGSMLNIRKASGVFGSASSASASSSSLGLSHTLSQDIPSPAPVEAFSMNPEDYELLQVIGHGSSATVYLATYKNGKKLVSIKVIDLDMFERNQIDELRRELQIMTLSKHANLLPVHGSFVNGSKLFIVTPFLSAGSGLDIMKTAYQKGMDESVIATILKQVLQGLEYLHSHGLIHRDIKAGNLLVNNDGLVQLADFGVSSSLTDHGHRGANRKTFVGTPCWMAPEVMDQSGYDYKADIWSFGITALELANGHAPYARFPPMKVLMLTLQNPPPTLDRERTKYKYSKSFKDMIDLCLQKDPAKRPTAEKLLAHSFFKGAKKPNYLVSTLLNGLTPITERAHLQQQQQQQGNGNTIRSQVSEGAHSEWDFDEDAKPTTPQDANNDSESKVDQKMIERLEKLEYVPSSTTRTVSFQSPTIIEDSRYSAEPEQSATLERNSQVKFRPSPVNMDARSSLSSLENGRTSNISVSSSNVDGGAAPRKSRFTVDGATTQQTRSDTGGSSGSVGSVQGDAPQTPAPAPLTQQQPSPQMQVKKGRFSVNSNVPGGSPPVMNLPPATSSSAPAPATTTPAALSTSFETSELKLGEGNDLVQSATSANFNPLPPSVGDTNVNTLERKAGRFAFQNLPPSAVTSPVLVPSEGPKVPRKFTIVSDNVPQSSPPQQFQPVPASTSTSTPSAPIATGDKKSRFKLVDAILEAPAYINALSILSVPTLDVTAYSHDSEVIAALLKQNETQRVVIQDLIALLGRVNAPNPPVKGTSTDSNIDQQSNN